MKKNLIVIQEYAKECGSACLLSIIRYFGGNVSMNYLVDITKTDNKGTNFYNLEVASKKVGLRAKSYKVSEIEQLFLIKEPFITQIIVDGFTHFVVVYKTTTNKVILMDPSNGKTVMSVKKFLEIWSGYVMLFEKEKELPTQKEKSYLKKIIVRVLKENKRIILKIWELSIIFTIMTCILAFYISLVINKDIGYDINNLVVISMIFLNIAMVKVLSDYCRYELLLFLNQKLDLSIMINTFNKILLLPYNYYKTKTTGEVISRINDIISVRNIISKVIIAVCLDMLITIGSALVLMTISIRMFGILLIIIFGYFLVLGISSLFIRKFTNLNQENNAKLNSFLVENISGYETIKGLHIESIIQKKFSKMYSNFLETNLFYERVINLEKLAKEMLEVIMIVLVIFVGIREVNNGNLSLGSFLTFSVLMNYFLEPLKDILTLNKDYFYTKNALKRLENLLEVDSVKFLEHDLKMEGDITVRNLSFSYNYYHDILRDINFKIKKQEKILILGSSGSGKSTLLKILYNYYDIDRNKILIGNNDLMDYGKENIRRNMCYISQNEILYNDTIKNNILLDRDISYDDFLNICHLFYINEIVQDKILGYDTLLEESGSNISGGERQRIILARTLLKKSELILIDEGFSQIDVNLERKILKNIFEYYKDKMMIIVSHRKENMDLYDKVLMLKDGKIVKNLERNKSYE